MYTIILSVRERDERERKVERNWGVLLQEEEFVGGGEKGPAGFLLFRGFFSR